MIRFDHVSLRYGQGENIFEDLSFDLAPGSFHFLTGASGAGKSSLLKLLYLAMRPNDGDIYLFNKNVQDFSRRELPKLRRKIGIVFQDFRLLPHLNVLENVALTLRIAGARRRKIYEHVAELLNWVGLGDRLYAYPETLSGGEQQRVAIARAVVGHPKILLADEPTGNLDDKIALRLLYLFEELNKMGTTIVIATHNQGLIQKFSYPRMHLEKGGLSFHAPQTMGGEEF